MVQYHIYIYIYIHSIVLILGRINPITLIDTYFLKSIQILCSHLRFNGIQDAIQGQMPEVKGIKEEEEEDSS